MTKKKKQQKGGQRQKRQQAKRERRSQRLRQTRRSAPPTAQLPIDPTVFDDLGVVRDGVLDSSALEDVLPLGFESDSLCEEPEFDEIELPSLEVAAAYAEIGVALGLDPDEMLQLPEEERDEQQFAILRELVARYYDEDLRDEVHAALRQLRQRLRREGDRERLRLAAAAQVLLEVNEDFDADSAPGVISGVILRSLDLGFDEIMAGSEVLSLDDAETPARDPIDFIERAQASGMEKVLENTLGRIPGVKRMLTKRIEKEESAGLEALYRVKLHLGLFSPEETARGAEIIRTALQYSDESTPAKLPEALELHSKEMMTAVHEYADQVMTPDRIAVAREQLGGLLRTKEIQESEWFSYLMVVYVDLKTDDIDMGRRALNGALFGESWAQFAQQLAEEYEVDRDDDIP